jgi:hypothetical protein
MENLLKKSNSTILDIEKYLCNTFFMSFCIIDFFN